MDVQANNCQWFFEHKLINADGAFICSKCGYQTPPWITEDFIKSYDFDEHRRNFENMQWVIKYRILQVGVDKINVMAGRFPDENSALKRSNELNAKYDDRVYWPDMDLKPVFKKKV